ncbi:polysaccharide pyruvyl transferase family protein [Commensalibacter nepenthis]|uniref:Polysaccharide pyruvyl transferase family protein n=1 Tax=Commensalibacter nepenthis TaxID=3043872 RepID=A0ABT6Q5D9_9PROT|nr:polysaccharide pyruvyl transferase family protein [Commensalibacter sp. TBRC 10068]MDI2111967.1 polysaccharide pyruvyl transferase family protein [Commensalibacter sp. TBRC 10068]
MLYNDTLSNILNDFHYKYRFIYKSNPGNAGDSVIAAATYDFFEKRGFSFHFWSNKESYDSQRDILLYAGGGNLIEGLYLDGYNFIHQQYKLFYKTIILPHTIRGYNDLFTYNQDRFIICCREEVSYSKILSLGYVANKSVLLTHDMAFGLILNKYLDKKAPVGFKEEVNCFRTDDESKTKANHENNHDISLSWNGDYWANISLARNSTRSLISFLREYKVVNTDRLHIAILGSLLNMRVNFYPNSYYKNEAVFNHSIQNMFSNTVFIK